MRLPSLRAALPSLICACVAVSVCCVGVAVYLVCAAETDATNRAARRMAAQSDTLARGIAADIAVFDLALREAIRLWTTREPGSALPSMPLLDLPLTSRYVGFMNVLNEVGDVVADPRSNVSRLVNFASRDYFQDQLKNPADTVMIGRPFGASPNQHASIPVSRRMNRPDGRFAGVVVAGVRLTWLRDLLAAPSSGPPASVTIRRDDGLILMQSPYNEDAVGRAGTADAGWQAYLRSGSAQITDDQGALHLFRQLGTPALVIERVLGRSGIAADAPAWRHWLALLTLVPGLCAAGLGWAAHLMSRQARLIEAASRTAGDETMRLLATMSHELRTPLTGILGEADLLAAEGDLSPAQSARLSRLITAGAWMRGIVDKVIDIARPDGIAEATVTSPCDLETLIRESIAMVEGEAGRQRVLLTSSVASNAPKRAMLDHARVKQMLINLLMNAVKFTAGGGKNFPGGTRGAAAIAGTVELRLTGERSRIRFEVVDTGPGVPADKRDRLFRAYDRLDISSERDKGTGLGLSITERFARSMGGQVGHSDNPGGGSVFWIELPLTEPAAPAPTAARPAPPPTAEPLRVLLADDLDITRDVTADYLRGAGHEVTEAVDGETALAALRERDFDVVLMDMRMPVMDGLEVTRRIRAMPDLRASTPVVLVTADLGASRLARNGEAGVDGCVTKPFTRAELLNAVAAAAQCSPVSKTERPKDPAFEDLAFDEATRTDMARSLGEESFAKHLCGATRRIEELLVLLERPDARTNPDLRGAVHDLIGVAGLLGLTALAESLRRYDTAGDRPAPTAALHEAASAAVAALRRDQASAALSRSPAG